MQLDMPFASWCCCHVIPKHANVQRMTQNCVGTKEVSLKDA
jgi:hypothetical protein